jgi:shikimate kinase
MRIYLVGFMGSGKSTLGKKAAAFFQVPFEDTDEHVEREAGKSIREIFQQDGESYFRQLEKKALYHTLSFEKTIIAVGGGLPCFDDNMNWINQKGISIYLQWPLSRLKQNLLADFHQRPLLASTSENELAAKIEDLMLTRIPYYEMAALTLEMTGDLVHDEDLVNKACRYIW